MSQVRIWQEGERGTPLELRTSKNKSEGRPSTQIGQAKEHKKQGEDRVEQQVRAFGSL
jgi:hypothetical protein